MAYVLVQHLDPHRESILADLLATTTRMPIRQVTGGLRVEPNHVYVIPPPHDIEIADGALKLVPRREADRPHMPIDLFFRTLARAQGTLGIGVVLSGVASDGTLGLQAIKAEGGIAIAQDPTSARFDGMPRSAIASGSVDLVLSPEEIAGELTRLSLHPYVAATGDEEGGFGRELAKEKDGLDKVLAAVHAASGVDLTLYRRDTIRKRIARRMALLGIATLADYRRRVAANPQEAAVLYQDCLTPVTSFFRDPKAFEALSRDVLPRLLKGTPPGKPLRVWVPACATGEEVFSIVIGLLEEQAERGTSVALQVFATDVSDVAVHTAREGTYLASIVQDVSPERLRRFFTPVNGDYRVGTAARDVCVFAHHDVLRDPPFSRMDLVCCRNLLAYLEPDAQRRVLAMLHYALRPDGFLMIGASEAVDATEWFAPSDSGHGIYVRRATPGTLAYLLPRRPPAEEEASGTPASPQAAPGQASRMRTRPPRPAEEKDRRIAELERDLDDLLLQLRNVLQDYDSAAEELRTSVAEAQEVNEELQNINEELQTAREQVQSANEELVSLNQELQDRNQELRYAADDLVNVVDGLDLPMVTVNRDLTVRRFTSAAERLFNLGAGDVGRPLGDLRSRLADPDLAPTVRRVIETLRPVDRAVRDDEGRGYALRIRPYRTRDLKIDGAVIIFVDVSAFPTFS
jgi:chemotaxis methyl-accepting protein methylase